MPAKNKRLMKAMKNLVYGRSTKTKEKNRVYETRQISSTIQRKRANVALVDFEYLQSALQQWLVCPKCGGKDVFLKPCSQKVFYVNKNESNLCKGIRAKLSIYCKSEKCFIRSHWLSDESINIQFSIHILVNNIRITSFERFWKCLNAKISFNGTPLQ